MSSSWPLAELRLAVGDVELRPTTEPDLDALTALLPSDLELDPAATTYEVDQHANRAAVLRQGYWRAMGTWRPQSWVLPFTVRAAGDIVGQQTLEGPDFANVRTVDSASWLVPPARGHGIGQAMRRAVLTLAFDRLDALAAVSSAWADNAASLGVSAALGYLPNGAQLQVRDPGPSQRVMPMTHVWLPREVWYASAHARAAPVVEIERFDACRPYFGDVMLTSAEGGR